MKIASVIHWCFSGVKIRPKLPQFSPSSSVWIDVVLLIMFSPLLRWCSSLHLHLFMELRHVVLCLELNYRSLQMLFKVVYYFSFAFAIRIFVYYDAGMIFPLLCFVEGLICFIISFIIRIFVSWCSLNCVVFTIGMLFFLE